MKTPLNHPRDFSRHGFNMVEIVLALVIVVIGVIGVMAIFPVAQNAQRSAIGINESQDAADQFLRVFSSRLKGKWAMLGALPQENPGDTFDDREGNWTASDAGGTFTAIEGIDLMYHDANNNGSFDYLSGGSRDNSGMFKISHRSAANIEDFSGMMRVWASPVVFKKYDPQSGYTGYHVANRENGVKVNVEISWPSFVPYERREKAQYSTVVFRPAEESVEEVKGAFRIAFGGKIRYKYYGSEAGYKNGFWMAEPYNEMIFEHQNRSGDKTFETTVEKTFTAGTTFNFYALVQPNWNSTSKQWKHYAWADPETVGGDPISRNDDLNVKHEISTVVAVGRAHTVNMSVTNKNGNNKQIAYYILSVPQAQREAVYGSMSNNRGWPVQLLTQADPVTGMTGIKITCTGGLSYNDSFTYTFRTSGVPPNIQVATVTTDNSQGATSFNSSEFVVVKEPTVTSDIPYFDGGNNNYNDGQNDGAFDIHSGNPYCVVTELVPNRKWLFGFEDIPGWHGWNDWDYNDIVVDAELLSDDGVVVPSIGAHTVNGRIEPQKSGHGDWRITVVKPDGTCFETKNMKYYEGPAIAVWVRPQGSGSQSITVDGETITWANENMVVVSGYNMNIKTHKVNNKWVCDVEATDADFSVMN